MAKREGRTFQRSVDPILCVLSHVRYLNPTIMAGPAGGCTRKIVRHSRSLASYYYVVRSTKY